MNGTDWNMAEILRKYNFITNEKPSDYGNCPFFGNGTIGSRLQFEGDRLMLDLGRGDVEDHRKSETDGWNAYSRPRLLIGKIYFDGIAPIKNENFHGRLSLYDAEYTASAETQKGQLTLQHYVHAEKMVMAVRFAVSGNQPLPKVSFEPHPAVTTRAGLIQTDADKQKYFRRYGDAYRKTLQFYRPNPEPIQKISQGIHISLQNLLAGGNYAAAWQEIRISSHESVILISIENSYPEGKAEELAVSHILDTRKFILSDRWDELLENHKNWWHQYYPISKIQLPDEEFQKFYWMQIYKYACATRKNGVLIDTPSLWLQKTPWPYATNDFNTQMTYYPIYRTGRFELGVPLLQALKKNMDVLITNVKPDEWRKDSAFLATTSSSDFRGYRDEDMRYYNYTGNLMWLLHDVWLHYDYTLDKKILTEILRPLLKRALCFYFHLLYEDENKVLHLPVTGSPEYDYGETADCSYDLALLRWGCLTYQKLSEILNFEDPVTKRCRDVLNRLTFYSVDHTGIRIGADLQLKIMHRHFSHLMCIYPLYLMTGKTTEERELMEKSVEHWMSFPGYDCGFPIAAAASMEAILGDGDRVCQYLHFLLSMERVKPNSLYVEGGPCIETPLMAMQAMHDMLIQDHDGIIRIFPAFPELDPYNWKDAAFDGLCTSGGYCVSAEMKNGKTTWVRIKAKASGICRVNLHMEFPVSDKIFQTEDSIAVFSLKAGEEAVFYSEKL